MKKNRREVLEGVFRDIDDDLNYASVDNYKFASLFESCHGCKIRITVEVLETEEEVNA